MKKTSVTLPGFTPRPYPIGRAADLAAHSLSADSLVSVESVEVVNPSISGDSPVSVESIFEKPIGSKTFFQKSSSLSLSLPQDPLNLILIPIQFLLLN